MLLAPGATPPSRPGSPKHAPYADRDKPGRYFTIVEFDSFEDAAKNNDLPEVQEMAGKQMEIAKGEPTFYNLDVLFEGE